jgi:hypothetical protein
MRSPKLWLILSLTIIILTANSCFGGSSDRKSVAYFKQNINQSLSYDQLVERFGPPQRNSGSGIDIYEYDLADSTKIAIGYAGSIYYVKHLDQNGIELETILQASPLYSE